MKSNGKSDGFSFIELMIVIAIIGVMATIAVPNYARYVSRAQVNRVYQEVAAYQRIIEDKLSHNAIDDIATDPISVLGFIDSSLTTVVFGTFQNQVSSTIIATLDGQAGSAIRDAVFTFSRSAFGVWSCSVANTGPGWKPYFTPSACQ